MEPLTMLLLALKIGLIRIKIFISTFLISKVLLNILMINRLNCLFFQKCQPQGTVANKTLLIKENKSRALRHCVELRKISVYDRGSACFAYMRHFYQKIRQSLKNIQTINKLRTTSVATVLCKKSGAVYIKYTCSILLYSSMMTVVEFHSEAGEIQ